MFCKNCGNELNENASFCNKCGANVRTVKESAQNNTFAIVGFIVACISIFLNFWGVVGIAAIILSSLGLIQINKTGEKGKKLAVAGISIGIFSVIYAFVLLALLI